MLRPSGLLWTGKWEQGEGKKEVCALSRVGLLVEGN